MSVEVPQVLQLQGGTPQLKSGQTFAENLKITRNQEGGALSGGVMSLLSSSGIGGLMSGNPMASIVSTAQSAIGGMQNAIAAAIGGGTTPASVTALGGLSAALGSLSGTAAALLGLATGTYGPMDVILHANTVGMAGNPPPAALSSDTVRAPTMSQTLVTTTQQNAQTITNAIVAGATTDAAGASQVSALTTGVQSVIDGSNNAIAGLRALIPVLATAQAFGGAMAVGTHPDATDDQKSLLAWLASVMDPDVFEDMMTTARAEFYVPPPVITTLAPLINTYNVAYSFLPKPAASTGTTIEVT